MGGTASSYGHVLLEMKLLSSGTGNCPAGEIRKSTLVKDIELICIFSLFLTSPLSSTTHEPFVVIELDLSSDESCVVILG